MKKFIQNFNNLIIKRIFILQNKTNNNFKISNFNKFLITFISLLFFYLFYLLLPVLFDKTWLQSHLESQLLKEFKMNFSTSSNISYRILPKPHFLIKDSKIFKEGGNKIASLADIKNLKIFINQTNFLKKKNITIDHIKINDANFSLSRDDIKLLKDNSNKKFSNKIIKINKSSIFFKDNYGETITIIKILNAFFLPDNENLLNIYNIQGKVFNIPFSLNYKNKLNTPDSEELQIIVKALKLNIFDGYDNEEDSLSFRKNVISYLNFIFTTIYKIEENIITFNSTNSRIKSTKVNYNGKLSLDPFNLNLNINLDNYEISGLLNNNSILNEFIKTELLFNENISINSSINTTLDSKKKFFQNAKINFNIINGKINFNKTRLINKKIGFLELENSNLNFENDRLILNTDILIDINNSDKLFSLLQINKKFRKPIKNILINLDYDFLTKHIKFNNLKIENKEASKELLIIMEGFSNNNTNNWNKSRRLFNYLFKFYEG
jgi:hypothetical protein